MKDSKSVLVVGGGIAGIQASLDAADRGFKVYLVEKTPSIGGRMAQLDKTFPTMDCSICILAPKMAECYRHSNITLLTYSEVQDAKGSIGNFEVAVLKKARHVKEDKCVGCGICTEKCPVKVPNEFEMGLADRKAIYMPFPQAVPRLTTIDEENCLFFQKGTCRVCEKLCEAGAIDFDEKPEEIVLNVDAIILATGFDVFNPKAITAYGYGKYKNVITAMELERLICASGPTDGYILRPSDGKEPESVVFIQCVGSRDQRYNPYCSSICCKYAIKDAVLIREHHPEIDTYVFYIDLRAFGKGFQEFANRSKEEYGINYIRSNPGEIREDPITQDLTIWYEDTLTRTIKPLTVGLVVLCTASIPRPDNKKLSELIGVELDDLGFFRASHDIDHPVDLTVPGVYGCGFCLGPRVGDIPHSVMQAGAAVARMSEELAGMEEA